MLKESSILHNIRKIQAPKDAVALGKRFLEDLDRQQLLVCCLDAKNQSTAINVLSIEPKKLEYVEALIAKVDSTFKEELLQDFDKALKMVKNICMQK